MARRRERKLKVINPLGRNLRERCDCGKLLTSDRSYYCCIECRNRYCSKGNQTHSLAEPKSRAEIERFNAELHRRKTDMYVEEIETIQSLTPEDESPEAEKKLRELLTPPPEVRFFADLGYSDSEYYGE